MDVYLLQVEHALQKVIQLQECCTPFSAAGPTNNTMSLSSQLQQDHEIPSASISLSTSSSSSRHGEAHFFPPVIPFATRGSEPKTITTTSTTTSRTNASLPFHLPSLRRALRTLDRAMLSLEERLVTSLPYSSLSYSNFNSLTRDDQIDRSLHDGILCRLFTELQLYPDVAARNIVVSTMETAARLVHFLQQQQQNGSHASAPVTQFRLTQSQYHVVLQRVLRAVEQHQEENNDSNKHNHNFSTIIRACAPWIEVLNLQWIWQLSSTRNTTNTELTASLYSNHNIDHDDDGNDTPKHDLPLLERLLHITIRTFQHHDDFKNGVEKEEAAQEEDEAMVQWRILTGFHICHVAALYEKHNSMQTVNEWLRDLYLDLSGNIHTFVHEQAAAVANHFLGLLQTYIITLYEFVLDTLDAVAVIGIQPLPSSEKVAFGASQDSCDNHDHYYSAVEHALRHVTLILHALEAMGSWSLISMPQICTLWTSLSRSFIGSGDSGETMVRHCTTCKLPPRLPAELDFQLCNALLQFACIVAKLLHDHDKDNSINCAADYTCALSMTLLRTVKYPDRVLETEPFWELIQQALTATESSNECKDNDIRRVCQLAVLTPQGATCHNPGSVQQTQYNQIRKRLADLLMACPVSTTRTNDDEEEEGGWDGYFLKQFRTLSIPDT